MSGFDAYGSIAFGDIGLPPLYLSPVQAKAQALVENAGWTVIWTGAEATAWASVENAGFIIVFNPVEATAYAFVEDIAFIPSGSISLVPVEAKARAYVEDAKWEVLWKAIEAVARAYSENLTWTVFFAPGQATASAYAEDANWIASGNVDWTASEAIARAFIESGDFNYVPIEEIPNLDVRRISAGAQVSVNVIDPVPGVRLQIKRTDSYIGPGSAQALVPVAELPFIENVTITETYRYMGSWAISGVKGGVAVFVEGSDSIPRITFGKNKTL